MPYIDRYDRPEMNLHLNELQKLLETAGDCNYAITYLLHQYLKKKTLRYHNINEVVGILECAKMEFYATIARPYEQLKADENGPIGVLLDVEALDYKRIQQTLWDLENRVEQLESNGFRVD